jgi:hypothetical protein
MDKKIDQYADEIALYCCDRMTETQRGLLRVILAIAYMEGQREGAKIPGGNNVE